MISGVSHHEPLANSESLAALLLPFSSNSKKKNNVFSKIKNVFLNKSLKIADKITKNALNSEIIQLLNDFGEDINLVYSNQELKFKQLSKKQMKALKKKKGSGKYE